MEQQQTSRRWNAFQDARFQTGLGFNILMRLSIARMLVWMRLTC